MIDIFTGLLFLTAFLLFGAVLNSYYAYQREVKITRELLRLSKKNEFEALYE